MDAMMPERPKPKTIFNKNLNAQAGGTLFTLPPELRLIIYAFVFGHDTHQQEINFAQLARYSPSKSLLQTCQLIYKEARDLYNQAARSFWPTHTFTITAADTAITAIEHLQDTELAHMQDIRIFPEQSNVVWGPGNWEPIIELKPGPPLGWEVDVVSSPGQDAVLSEITYLRWLMKHTTSEKIRRLDKLLDREKWATPVAKLSLGARAKREELSIIVERVYLSSFTP